MPMIGAKVADLKKQLKDQRNLRVDKMYLSGGGNEDGDCRKMTLAWIKGWVGKILAGEPMPKLSQMPGFAGEWEEVRP